MARHLRAQLLEAARTVAPLVGVVCLFQLTFIQASAGLFLQFLAGAMLVVAGMTLIFTGIDAGIVPMGRFIGAELPRKGSLALILAVAFALGFATTVAEPDVLVLTTQVEAASEGAIASRTLIYLIAGGVGVFTGLAMLRVIRGLSMAWLLIGVYGVMLLLSFVAPAAFVPLAYDSGSVTTGVLTAPVVLALALGVTSVLAGRSALEDGFGLLGLASAGPIIVVLVLGLLAA